MEKYFECKVKYEKINDKGMEKVVTENYLVEAVSFTDAEATIIKKLEPYITGEFVVVSIKRAIYGELAISEDGEIFFKAKISFSSIDEESGYVKKSTSYILVKADNSKEALTRIDELMKDVFSEYELPAVSETTIIDVFLTNTNK